MGDIEFGQCEVCNKENILRRTYFHYDIKCECHSPNHFVIIRHCNECEPKQPLTTAVHVLPSSADKR